MIGKDITCKNLCSSMSAERLSQRMREGIVDGNPLDATTHMEALLARKDYCSVRESIINAELDGALQPNTPTALMLGNAILDDRNAAFLLKDIGEVLVAGRRFVDTLTGEDQFKYCSGPDQLKEASKNLTDKQQSTSSFEKIQSNIAKALEKAEAVKGFTQNFPGQLQTANN